MCGVNNMIKGKRKILFLFLLILILNVSCVSAITNIKPNGDFDLYPNSPIKTGTGWIGNESTRWNIFYTSSTSLHSAQLINSNLVTITGSDGGINDISVGGIPSSDPVLASWQSYGTVVNSSTTYTAFAFIDVNKTNAVYFNVRQAYTNGTMLSALISSRNTGTGYQYLEYQFTTSPNIHWCRVGLVTRNANTKVTYYAAGAYQGTSGQLNKPTSIISITPTTSILPNMQPTFAGTLYDIDSDVGICNQVKLNINGVDYTYNECDGSYTKNNLFLPSGTSTYNLSIIDLWTTDTISETYSLFVPDIQYVDVVSDTSSETIYTGLFSERFIYFVVYIAIMVLLARQFTQPETLWLFAIIVLMVEIILFANVTDIDNMGGTTQYILMLLSNTYLLVLMGYSLKKES